MRRLIPSVYVRKLIVFGVLLGCLPVLALGTFSYNWTSKLLKEKKLQENQKKIQQIQSYLERSLMNYDVVLRALISSGTVQRAMQSNLQGEDFIYYQEVSRQLTSAVPFDAADSEICLINYTHNWVLNGSGLYQLHEAMFEDRYRLYGTLPKTSDWISYFESLPEGENVYDYFFSGNAVELVKKIPLNTLHPTGIAVMKLPCTYLSHLLELDQEENEILILDENFHVIAAADNKKIGLSFQGSELAARIVQETNFEMETTEGLVNVTASISEYNGWYYISLVSIAEILEDSIAVKQLTVFTAGLCLIAVVVISIYGSRKMYQPINNLCRELLNPITEESGHQDEFLLFQRRIRAMIHRISEQSEQMHLQVRHMKEHFTMKLLMGDLNKQEWDTFLSLFDRYREDIPKRVVVIQYDNLEENGYNKEDSEILMFALNNIVTELMEPHSVLAPVLIMQSQVTIIRDTKEETKWKEIFEDAIKTIQTTIKHYYGVSVSIGISRVFCEYQKTPIAFREGQEALKYRIKQGNGAIIFLEEIEMHQTITPIPYLKSQEELIIAVKDYDLERALNWLDLFLEDVFCMEVSHLEYQIPVAGLLLELISTVQEDDENSIIPQNGAKSLFEQLFTLKTREKIRFWFAKQIIEPFIQCMKERYDHQSHKLTTTMKQIIETKYDQDLTLEICAAEMNYHPGYLRRIFFQETGKHFGEYLIEYRMEIAKKWLEEGDMKVLDIAKCLKYSNSQNFIRCFKRYTGFTPGQYREKFSKK